MRGLPPEAVPLLGLLLREDSLTCDPDAGCDEQPDVPDALERELVARRLVTLALQPCGNPHLHITPLGRLALRLPRRP